MSFPLSYKGSIKIERDASGFKNISVENFRDTLLQNLNLFAPKQMSFLRNGFAFFSNYSLVRFQYETEIEFDFSETPEVNYKLDLSQLTAITFFIALFIAFFSRYSVWDVVMYSVLTGFVFYGVNLWFIMAYLNKAVQKTLNQLFPESTDYDAWLRDPKRCPACGEHIVKSDIFCPSCELRLKPGKAKPKKKPQPTPEKKLKIVYHYKSS